MLACLACAATSTAARHASIDVQIELKARRAASRAHERGMALRRGDAAAPEVDAAPAPESQARPGSASQRVSLSLLGQKLLQLETRHQHQQPSLATAKWQNT